MTWDRSPHRRWLEGTLWTEMNYKLKAAGDPPFFLGGPQFLVPLATFGRLPAIAFGKLY